MNKYLAKDYEGFRAELISLIPKKIPEWTDLSPSDFGIVLLEMLAYGLDIISYYQDRIWEESYLSTAEQRKSVIDLCKLIGYELKEATPASTYVVFEITPDPNKAMVIPRGFPVSTRPTGREEPIIFELDDDLIIPAANNGLEMENGEYIYKVKVTQGITVHNEIVGSSTGQPYQVFKLRHQNIIIPSLNVYVDEGSGFIRWTDVTNRLVQITEDGRRYWHEKDSDGYTYIRFGAGLNGQIPPEGINNIQATYRVGGGAHTNVGSNMITRIVSPLSRMKRVFNPEPAKGGSDSESIESAKRNAPLYLKTGDRAVTKSDYETLTRKVPGVIDAYAEGDASNRFLVHVYALIEPNMIEEEVLQNIKLALDDIKIINTQIETHKAPEQKALLSMDVRIGDLYSRNLTRATVNEIITSTFSTINRQIGKGISLFELYPLVSQVEGIMNFVINRCTTKPFPMSIIVSGNPSWSEIEVKPANNLRGTWKVLMISSNEFEVYFSTTGEFTGEEIFKGNGEFDTPFTSDNGEITFTISAGDVPMVENDYWLFKTQPYKDDIVIEPNECLVLDALEINVEGGNE